jgi:hypothetical protein
MKHILFALLIISVNVFTQVFAQTVDKSFHNLYAYGCDPSVADPSSCRVVLALSGINLREKPSFSSKALAIIPFGERVALTGKADPPQHVDEYRRLPMTPDSIYGYWQEVVWKNRKGYAFGAFLTDGIYRMTQPVYLLFENAAFCWEDTFASPDYHYYGMYHNRDSSDWTLKKIKPTFYQPEEGGARLRAETKERPGFVIALKTPIAEGKLLTQKMNTLLNPANKIAPKLPPVKLPFSNRQFRFVDNKPETSKNHTCELQLVEIGSGKKQTIVSNVSDQITVVWAGDLDRDGVTDFMLQCEDGHSISYQLFLSRFAKGKNLVWPAGIYRFGDCC